MDPFAGSGSTGKAAVLEGYDFVGHEMDEHSVNISNGRIAYVAKPKADLSALFD